MKVVMPGQFVTCAMWLEVADVLYRAGEKFGCKGPWTRDSRKTPGALEAFDAQPLFSGYSVPFGLSSHVSTNIWFGESRWLECMRGADFQQGKPEGYIEFTASLQARMSVSKGYLLDTVDGVRQFLCWASEYQLPDGTTCFRLNTPVGLLWVRGAEQQAPRKRSLQYALMAEAAQIVSKGSKVVRLEEYNFGYKVGALFPNEHTPWDGMSCVDGEERVWHILPGSLSLDCLLRLDTVGRENIRLRDRQQHVLELPYQTVWERSTGSSAWGLDTEPDQRHFIPLDF
ncbi:MAG TPA: hypothetical protein VFO38_02270 [Candidatus Saccharimonadales bacterium]|nr:hypothetical protein [Candidatus Saccharimonadales bacterium]